MAPPSHKEGAMTVEARVSHSVADGVARITLVRTEARNAIDAAMVAALRAATEACAGDPSMRALLISAEGPAFTVGGDLAYFARRLPDLDVALGEMIPSYHRTLAR